MNINEMIEKIKGHPDSEKIGMIASHVGVVRGTSRDGRDVTGIEVAYDHEKIKIILQNIKQLSGIVQVLVNTNEGNLKVGDEILAVAVAGDIRDNVFPALIKAVDHIKKDASKKKELFRAG